LGHFGVVIRVWSEGRLLHLEETFHMKKILCPVDGSPESLEAARRAGGMVELHGAELTLLHVVPLSFLQLLNYRPTMLDTDLLPTQLEERLNSQAEEHLKKALEVCGCEAKTAKRLGHPAEVIVDMASRDGYDLVVMGHRGLGGLSRLVLGSVSAHVVHHCPTSVLIVKAETASDPG
jgi:nucleotide-binding universal stress UspA family protein